MGAVAASYFYHIVNKKRPLEGFLPAVVFFYLCASSGDDVLGRKNILFLSLTSFCGELYEQKIERYKYHIHKYKYLHHYYPMNYLLLIRI